MGRVIPRGHAHSVTNGTVLVTNCGLISCYHAQAKPYSLIGSIQHNQSVDEIHRDFVVADLIDNPLKIFGKTVSRRQDQHYSEAGHNDCFSDGSIDNSGSQIHVSSFLGEVGSYVITVVENVILFMFFSRRKPKFTAKFGLYILFSFTIKEGGCQ